MAWTEPRSPRRTLRGIALFEGVKGVAALLIGLGLVELLHHDLRRLVLELTGHFGLNPSQPFPTLLLHYADLLGATPLGPLESLLAAYTAIRLTEAYGLWYEKAWAEWLGAGSGGLYVPFELRHLWHAPDALGAAVLAVNLLIVGYLARQLWQRRLRRNTDPGAAHHPQASQSRHGQGKDPLHLQ